MKTIFIDGPYVYESNREPGVYLFSGDPDMAWHRAQNGGETCLPRVIFDELDGLKCQLGELLKTPDTEVYVAATLKPMTTSELVTLKAAGFTSQEIIEMRKAGLVP